MSAELPAITKRFAGDLLRMQGEPAHFRAVEEFLRPIGPLTLALLDLKRGTFIQ